jgi:two-component system, OmpR family, sensor histidine kinase BaeS
MTERSEHPGPPWARGGGGPDWGAGGPRGWGGPGRRFRRGSLLFLLIAAVLVAVLASVVAAIVAGHAPPAGITYVVSIVVVVGLVLAGRAFWRNTRTVGTLMDAADRVSEGDYSTRVPDLGARQLGRLTTSINAMTEHLESNERRRRELLADVTHELRTPLQVIRGTVEGMLDGLYPLELDRLRPLLEETLVMARLLEDLRTLSMAEAGVLELHRETVDPRALAAEAIEPFRVTAERDGVSLETAFDGATTTIEADPVRVSEILTNLLANALKHTPRGGRIVVRIAGDGDVTTFAVEDDGRGIAADQLPFVFDRWTTSDRSRGSGLGLAIAKRLAEAHGGTIEATAGATGGTTIRFTIPSGERGPVAPA